MPGVTYEFPIAAAAVNINTPAVNSTYIIIVYTDKLILHKCSYL